MTIPRKGSRTIDVDGKPFRFLVREKGTGQYDQDDEEQKELQVTVQEEVDEPGRPMQFTWPHGHTVTPEDVRQTVRDGMKAGWNPSAKGAAFVLGGALPAKV